MGPDQGEGPNRLQNCYRPCSCFCGVGPRFVEVRGLNAPAAAPALDGGVSSEESMAHRPALSGSVEVRGPKTPPPSPRLVPPPAGPWRTGRG